MEKYFFVLLFIGTVTTFIFSKEMSKIFPPPKNQIAKDVCLAKESDLVGIYNTAFMRR